MIWPFNELPQQEEKNVGGKAATLARLYQESYPVPDGFIIAPNAFIDGEINDWSLVEMALEQLWSDNGRFDKLNTGRFPVAVRSSALSEDSANASYAGEFETVLNLTTFDEIKQAIQTVYDSQFSQRVVAYREAVDPLESDKAEQAALAIIVQQMVPAEIAGVLFTADPVSGGHGQMVGNFVYGLGEQLVAGEVNAESFVLKRPSGKYQGPLQLKTYGKQLYKMADKLSNALGGPQDIEWAVADRKLFLLQTRPITTLQGYNQATGEHNDSLQGDFLWTNTNFGEAVPDVMTPYTWSFLQIYFEEVMPFTIPGNFPLAGNIGGRFYFNVSVIASIMAALGIKKEKIYRNSETFGWIPENVEIPIIPFSRRTVLRHFVPEAIKANFRMRRLQKEPELYLATVNFDKFRDRMANAQTNQELLAEWESFEPIARHACVMTQVSLSRLKRGLPNLRSDLEKLVSEEETNAILSGVAPSDLASLGPLLGLAQLQRGEISRNTYIQQFGHRGPHEIELSTPRPAEDTAWIDAQLSLLPEQDSAAPTTLIANQKAQQEAAWQRLLAAHPSKAKKLRRRLDEIGNAYRVREQVRSEMVRMLWAARAFALRAGELLGLDDDIVFFLSKEEILTMLRGEPKRVLTTIPARRGAYERFTALPPYPSIINGRFDPYTWANDPNKRFDIFDAHQTYIDNNNETSTITGYPGAAGIVEGYVRRLDAPEEGLLLQPGEILVTNTTNIGWTPLFPRATAIITDVGAPLSHAAIVARELGIPAVVGCGNATMRLQTGDRVRVNGGQGSIVKLYSQDTTVVQP